MAVSTCTYYSNYTYDGLCRSLGTPALIETNTFREWRTSAGFDSQDTARSAFSTFTYMQLPGYDYATHNPDGFLFSSNQNSPTASPCVPGPLMCDTFSEVTCPPGLSSSSGENSNDATTVYCCPRGPDYYSFGIEEFDISIQILELVTAPATADEVIKTRSQKAFCAYLWHSNGLNTVLPTQVPYPSGISNEDSHLLYYEAVVASRITRTLSTPSATQTQPLHRESGILPSPNQSDSLSRSTTIGIGIGAGLGGLMLIGSFIIICVLIRRRKKPERVPETAVYTDKPELHAMDLKMYGSVKELGGPDRYELDDTSQPLEIGGPDRFRELETRNNAVSQPIHTPDKCEG